MATVVGETKEGSIEVVLLLNSSYLEDSCEGDSWQCCSQTFENQGENAREMERMPGREKDLIEWD